MSPTARNAALSRAAQVETRRISRAADIRLRPEPALARPRPADPSVSVIIPTLNEAANIALVIKAMPACVAEIIVVDGRSVDDTVGIALATDQRVRVVLEQRRGKGIAMLTGFASASTDLIVAIDADCSMDPREIAMLRASLASGFDLVKGSRAAVGGGSDDFSPLRRHGNAILTRLANVAFGTRWTDMCYGYFGFWRDVLPALDLRWRSLTTRALAEELESEVAGSPGVHRSDALPYGNGFEIETVLFLRAARAKLRIAEVPSREHARNVGASNLRTVRDGVRVLGAIGRERVRREQVPVVQGAYAGRARQQRWRA